MLELFATDPQQRLDAWAIDGDRTAAGTPILAADISGSLSLPSEWYLAVFWYLLPATFIVLVGLGAADFLSKPVDAEKLRESIRLAFGAPIIDHE